MNKTPTVTILVAIAVVAILAFMYSAKVRREGTLPEVNVSVKDKGQLPKYELTKTREGRLPDVEVDTKAGRAPDIEMTRPDVDVKTEKRVINVPTGVEINRDGNDAE